jgi:hypothetical protein
MWEGRTRTRIPARYGSVPHDGCAVACGTGTHHRPIVRVRSGLLNVCKRASPRARTVDDVAEVDEPAHARAAREALELKDLLAHAGRPLRRSASVAVRGDGAHQEEGGGETKGIGAWIWGAFFVCLADRRGGAGGSEGHKEAAAAIETVQQPEDLVRTSKANSSGDPD